MTPWDWSFDLDDEEASRDARALPRGRGAGPPLAAQGPLRQRRPTTPTSAARRCCGRSKQKRPRLAVCGHIHESWGCERRDRRDAGPQPRPDRHLDRALGPGWNRAAPSAPGSSSATLILVAARRQPQPGGRQRRPAGHRQGLRRRPDDGRPDRRRLLARARHLGPLPRRRRRPLRPQDDADAGHGALDPGLAAGRLRPDSSSVLFVARVLGGVAAGMAYPTTLALITALWSGAGTDQGDRPLVGARRRRLAALGPLLAGALLEALRLGLGLPHHRAAGGARPLLRLAPGPRPRQRDDGAGRPPRRHPLDRCWWRRWCWRSTSRRNRARGRLAIGLGIVAVAAVGAFVLRQRRVSARRSTTSTVAGRRIFWVAACAGIIVFGSLMGAMFIGQQFVQNVLDYSTLDAGLAILPGAVGMVDRRAALGQAGRGARRPLHPAGRLRLLPARLPGDAAALERGHRLLEGRPRLRPDRRSASASPAPPPRTR